MYPNNQAHNFIVNGAGQLPYNTHVMGSLEYGFWLQNAPFIPLTSNSKLQQSLSSVGAPNSLGGDVQPFFANFTIDSNPIERLNLNATYSYFDYDNLTPAITFTGVKSLNDVAGAQTPFTAYPFAFSEQDVSIEPTYRVTDTLAAHFNFEWQTNHNGGLEVLQQDQTSYGPALDWNPYPWLNFRADYQHAHRDSPGYNNNRASRSRCWRTPGYRGAAGPPAVRRGHARCEPDFALCLRAADRTTHDVRRLQLRRL